MPSKKGSILVFSAHSDDFVLGAGGTIAKYAREGKKVLAIIFSYGEMSHPWLKGSVVQKIRIKETMKSCQVLNCKFKFFNLREGEFIKDANQKNVSHELKSIIKQYKPSKIFTHSSEDPHRDHRAIHQITLDIYRQLRRKPELYTYSIWNPVSFKTHYPSLYVDISKTFSIKWKSLKPFRSQRVIITYPSLLVLWKGVIDGFKLRSRFAERFFRIR